MNIGVAYGKANRQVWLQFEVPAGTTIADAIERSAIRDRFPEIDLSRQKVGIFGRVLPLDHTLADGDRVEIYRAITADPDLVERRD